MTLQTALVALVLFQIKHLVADFMLQGPRITAEKGYYGRAGGLWHAAIHVAGTIPILLWLGPAPGTFIALLAAEFVLHYHIDWIKAAHARHRGLAPEDRSFWVILGTDQTLHQLTYIGMLWWIAT
jgi:hypothetical protein